jgi:DNA-binding NarL/FixJ family response regulator
MDSRRVVILSHHPLFAEGMKALLSPCIGVQVVGVVKSVGRLRRALNGLRPDVIIVDGDTSDAIQQVLSLAPQTRVIMVTLNDNRMDIYDATHVEKAGVQDLMDAIAPQGGRERREEVQIQDNGTLFG